VFINKKHKEMTKYCVYKLNGSYKAKEVNGLNPYQIDNLIGYLDWHSVVANTQYEAIERAIRESYGKHVRFNSTLIIDGVSIHKRINWFE